jgi:cell division protein FtsQ
VEVLTERPTGSEERFRQRRRARRLRLLRRVLVLLLLVGLVAGAVWLVFFSSRLAVHTVSVRGTAVLTEEGVRRTAAVPLDVPLALSDLDAVAARVETLPAVRSADVSRDWPDGLAIDVTERESVAAVEREGSWHGLDEEGVLFRSYPSRPEGLPQVQVRASTSVEALEEAAHVVVALPPDLLGRVQVIEVASIDAISFRLVGGARVTWGSADESEDKARVLEVLLREPASAYDVTAPGRPTLRPSRP